MRFSRLPFTNSDIRFRRKLLYARGMVVRRRVVNRHLKTDGVNGVAAGGADADNRTIAPTVRQFNTGSRQNFGPVHFPRLENSSGLSESTGSEGSAVSSVLSHEILKKVPKKIPYILILSTS